MKLELKPSMDEKIINTLKLDHLVLLCLTTERVWNFFIQIFRFSKTPNTLKELWGSWRPQLSHSLKDAGDLLVRTIIWNIRLERNAHILNDEYSSYASFILKIIHMYFSWTDVVPYTKKERLEDSAATANRSLKFLRTHMDSGDHSDRMNKKESAAANCCLSYFFLKGCYVVVVLSLALFFVS